jgi:hypothetical protein
MNVVNSSSFGEVTILFGITRAFVLFFSIVNQNNIKVTHIIRRSIMTYIYNYNQNKCNSQLLTVTAECILFFNIKQNTSFLSGM